MMIWKTYNKFDRAAVSLFLTSIAGMMFLGFFWFFMLTVQDIYCEGFKYESEFLCEDKEEVVEPYVD
jgi:hypothetical protein